MIISKVIIDNFIYYHLHAEQIITAAFLDGRHLGILEQSLTDTTFNNIISDYKVTSKGASEVLVLNFDKIVTIQNNQLSKIGELKKLNNNLILINVKKEIIDELKLSSLFKSENNIIDENGNYSVFYCEHSVRYDFVYSTDEIFQSYFLKLIKSRYTDSLDGQERYHSSSSVYLSKWINIKKFISNDNSFFLYSIYQLAVKIYKKWFEPRRFSDETEKPILVCQNLNSSYITSILSTLLGTNILILDQIGPINKIYSTLDSKIESGKSYIVVSDLVCMGTEIKIAKSLVEFLGGSYLGNVSIVRIQTIDPHHRSFEDTECVFVVDKNNNAEIGYEIKTDLDSI